MEAGNENEPQDDAAIIRNPTHCTAPVSIEKLAISPFLSAVGTMGEIMLQRINRPAVTAATRSPWGVKNLSVRHDSTVPIFYKELLQQEAQIVRNLAFDNIVGAALSSKTLEECKRNLAIEYCLRDLADILAKRYEENLGPLEAPKAIKASVDILSALEYLHTSALMMHGDLKSFNVLVLEDFETVKLCGMGPLSKSLNPDGTLDEDANTESDTIGVGLWSAPEVFAKTAANVTSKADIFSFGLIIYEMLVCMPPHTFPGIMDIVIAAPKELIKVRNSQKGQDLDLSDSAKDCDDDDTDELDDGVKQKREDMRKRLDVYMKKKKADDCYARKRLPAQNTIAAYEKDGAGAIKKIKYDDVIIDLVDEEEPTKDEADSMEKENDKNFQKDISDNTIKADQSLKKANDVKDEGLKPETTDVSQTGNIVNKADESPRKVESTTESLQPVLPDGNGADNEKPKAYLTIIKEASETMLQVKCSTEEHKRPNNVEIAGSPSKVESSTESLQAEMGGGNIASNDKRTDTAGKRAAIPPKRPEVSPEVVMVIDSSDEETDEPNKAYEVDSSDSNSHEYGTDDEEDGNQYSETEEFGETDDDYDAAEDDIAEPPEDDWDMDANFLNYGCLGTRPPIPVEIKLGTEYTILLEMFYVCTNKNIAMRPSAAQLLKAYQDNKPDQP